MILDSVKQLREILEEVQDGKIRREEAHLLQKFARLQLRLANLCLRAERLGIMHDFFDVKFDKECVKKYRRLVEQLGQVIRSAAQTS